MGKGQTSLELMAVVGIVLILFVSVQFTVAKRNGDINTFQKDSAIQQALDKTTYLMSVASINQGSSFNIILPSVFDGCDVVYTVQDLLISANCAGSDYVSFYQTVNVSNGTSAPPFVIGNEITLRSDNGTVIIE